MSVFLFGYHLFFIKYFCSESSYGYVCTLCSWIASPHLRGKFSYFFCLQKDISLWKETHWIAKAFSQVCPAVRAKASSSSCTIVSQSLKPKLQLFVVFDSLAETFKQLHSNYILWLNEKPANLKTIPCPSLFPPMGYKSRKDRATFFKILPLYR
jgi:hypothetical protein